MLGLVLLALGLPVNDLFRYALLLIAAVAVFAGAVSVRRAPWLAACAVVAVAALGQLFLPAPRIEEGHNVFLGESQGRALEAGLPAEAFRFMADRFDVQYPPERRCEARMAGCWRSQPGPDRAFAFSADGIYQRPSASRQVTGIDFTDPVWLRLGFVNEGRYNWYSGVSDLQRGHRERSLAKVLQPWQFAMPFFVMVRFPQAFVGSQLCWQGELLWEGTGKRFTVWRHAEMACRAIEPGDVGRRIFGVAIGNDPPLAMTLLPTATVRMQQLLEPASALIAVLAVLALLVRWDRRRLTLPFTFIGLSLVVVLLNDASFIGGIRPFEGGDDGLFYESTGRLIAQHLLAGDVWKALEGGEKVFYYGGPGLRYFRALEHFIFGDSFLGYLSLVLALPFLVFVLFGRFFSGRTALALTLTFIAIPIGALFGSSFFHYAKWAARGFADPAAAVVFVGAFLMLVGRTPSGPDARFAPAFGAGLLFALALFLRPNLAPGAAVLLGGAGLAALWHGEIRRLAGMCIGFVPVFSMALHNWVFGGVFILFSANATIPEALPMPPSAYVAALGELLRLDLAGDHVRRGVLQIARLLAGPSESFAMVPLHAVALAVVVRVGLARRYEPWLRLTAFATLALHSVALFYLSYDRYYYMGWLFTLLVVAVWVRDEGEDMARRAVPRWHAYIAGHPATRRLGSLLDWGARVTDVTPPARQG